MVQVDIDEANTHLSRLVARVEAGEEIVIARAGHTRILGRDSGDFVVPDDFDDPLPPHVLAGLLDVDTFGRGP